MMTSLFESFDPMLSLFNSNLLIIAMIIITPGLFTFSILSSRLLLIPKTLKSFMFSELSASLNNPNKKMSVLALWSIFMIILLLNLMGLAPYVYTLTSQMMFSLSLALPFWTAFILFSMFLNTKSFLSHMVPLSTPLPLSQFMTVIETVSQIIRPITLSVRLCANMTAGHILMGLTSNSIFIFNSFSFVLFMLLGLELAVAFIQSYVFVMLLSMYLSETN